MPTIVDDQIILPTEGFSSEGEWEPQREYCFEIIDFESFRLIERSCGLKEECSDCKSSKKFKVTEEGILELPPFVRGLLDIYDGQEYFVMSNEKSFYVKLKERICAHCSKRRKDAIALIPILETFICEECFDRAMHYRLYT